LGNLLMKPICKGDATMKNRNNDPSLEQKMKEAESDKDFEKSRGFGDKKLEGPNRPSE